MISDGILHNLAEPFFGNIQRIELKKMFHQLHPEAFPVGPKPVLEIWVCIFHEFVFFYKCNKKLQTFGFESEIFIRICNLFVSMTEANRKIVEFIRDEWVIPMNNNSKFAVDHDIDEKTVRRIKDDQNYQIALLTIMRICHARNLTLASFFKMVGI